MASIQTLPAELMLSIFSAGDIDSAVNLSSTTRRIRTMWLEHAFAITEAILSPQTPAYEDAISFTTTEVSLTHYNPSPEPSTWLPRLLWNVKRAMEVCDEYRDDLATKDPSWFEHEHSRPVESSYYLLRRLALAHYHRHLLPEIAAKLATDSMQRLQTHDWLYCFIINYLSWEVREKHAMVKPERERAIFEDTEVVEWEESGVIHLFHCAIISRREGSKREVPCPCRGVVHMSDF